MTSACWNSVSDSAKSLLGAAMARRTGRSEWREALGRVALAGVVFLFACDLSEVIVTDPPILGSISGVVTVEGERLLGATVKIGGVYNDSTQTSGNGGYSFERVADGQYTVTAQGPVDVLFSENQKGATIRTDGESVTVDFDGDYKRTSTVQGRVSAGGEGLAGILVSLGGVETGDTTTDASGDYRFSGMRAGDYTVVIRGFDGERYAFDPLSKSVNVGVDATESADFVGDVLVYITTDSLANGVVGTPYADTLEATGGDGSYAWSISANTLPAGLSLSEGGEISGTPMPPAGTSYFTVQVTSGGQTDTKELSITIVGLTSGLIAYYPLDGNATDASGNGLNGDVYGPVATPDRHGVAGGAMLFDGDNDYIKIPHDPSLNSESLGVSGWFRLDSSRPSRQSLVSHHGTGSSALDPYIVVVSPGDILHVGFEGDDPTSTVQNIGLDSPVAVGQWHHVAASYDADSGVAELYLDGVPVDQETLQMTLHTNTIGVMLGGDMDLNGGPRGDYLLGALDEVRLYSRPLTAADVQALCDVASICQVSHPPPVVTTTSLKAGVVGTPYADTLEATGGDGSYTWSVSAGMLPAGLALSAGGEISGTPTEADTSPFTVQVESAGQTAEKPLSITVHAVLSITTTSLADGVVGTAYSDTLVAAGGDGTYTWSIAVDSLPAGLSLDASTGEISGTPMPPAGTSYFTVRVTSGGQTATKGLSITVTPGLGIGFGDEQFALIPAGTFQMGSTNGGSDEQPVHTVNITQPFYMQKTEVTQAQWQQVMGSNPSYRDSCGDTCPVETVSWNDIQTFMANLNAQDTGKNYYRLPTEAEWEYAARAMTTGDYGGTGVLDDMGWYSDNSGSTPHPVAAKQANTWALFDMHGNVWEWVQDWYSESYYSVSPTNDPPGPVTASDRVLRGGWWVGSAFVARSASRRGSSPTYRSSTFGFRLARGELPPPTITTDSLLADGVVGAAYSQMLAAAGGDGSYTWAVSVDSLPAGLALDTSTGVISGTPDTAATSNFTVQVTSAGQTATKRLSITVHAGLSVTTTSLADGVVGAAYSQTLAAVGGDGSYTWAVSVDSLPVGLALSDSTGVISGTPTTAATSNFTVQVTSGDGQTATKELSITVVVGSQTKIVSTAFVDGDPVADVTPGQVISVPITFNMTNVSAEGDLGSVQFDLNYDTLTLTYDSVQRGILSGLDNVAHLAGKVKFAFVSTNPQGYPALILCVVHFTVSSGAIPGIERTFDLVYTASPTDTSFNSYTHPFVVNGKLRIIPP